MQFLCGYFNENFIHLFLLLAIFLGRMKLYKNVKVKFGFTCFDHMISGIAFKEKEGIIASFKLQKVKSLHIKDKLVHFLILKIIFKGSGREIYDAFRQFFLEENRRHAKCRIITDGHVEFYLKLSDDELEKTMKKVKKFLNENCWSNDA